MSEISTFQEMSAKKEKQITEEQKKDYHSPEFKKLGSVSELTHTSPGSTTDPSDGSFTFPNAYVT